MTLKNSLSTRSLIALLIATQMMPAYAVVPSLSNAPLNQSNLVEPNLLFVYDTSGSMAWSHVPDHAGLGGDTLASTNVIPGSVGYKAAVCNSLAFNPAISYEPPLQADLSSMADSTMTAAKYEGLRPTMSSGTNKPSMPFSTYGTTVNLETGYFGWDYAEASIADITFKRGNDNAGNATDNITTYNPGAIPSNRVSPTTPRVTRSGTSPNWTIRVDTGSTSHNVTVNDLIVVHSPANIAGIYRATAAVNSGSTRYYTFDISSTTAPPTTSPTVNWVIREAQPNMLYVFGSSPTYKAYYVDDGVPIWMQGGYRRVDITTTGGYNQYNGSYDITDLNFVDGKDGFITFNLPTNYLPGSTSNWDDNLGAMTPAMERPAAAHYYVFSGAGAAPTSYTDSRCKEMPSLSGGVIGDSTSFRRINIPGPGMVPFNTGVADAGGSAVIITQDELRRRFANWFTYYRRRSMTMKSAVSTAFGAVDADFRVGFLTIHTTAGNMTNAGGSSFRKIAKFDTAARTTWYSTLFGATDNLGSTPLREALSGAGRYFANKYSATVEDPMYGASSGGQCQRNFTILSTDGQWNETATNPVGCSSCTVSLTGTPANNSDTVGNPDSASGPAPYASYRARTDGVLDGKSVSGTLADVALHYYGQDIRSDLINNYGTDPAPFQNMVTHTIGLGLSGKLVFQEDYRTATNGDFYRIKTGAATCAAGGGGSGTTACDWPDPIANTGPERVDDLWHAAVNGRGTFFSAKDPTSLAKGLSTAITDLKSNVFKAVAPTTASPVLSDEANVAYVASYRNSTWTGRLEAKLINPQTGQFVPTASPLWRGHQKLDEQVATGGGTGWDTQRKIVIGRGDGTATPFRWDSLNVAQQTVFRDGKDVTYGQRLVTYLRGDKSHEGDNGAKLFRTRGDDVTGDTTAGILGDIVNSRPVVVAGVGSRYSEGYHSGYSDFVTSVSTRSPVVYVGGNDGMLHAFDATSSGSGETRVATANSGKELWAYIPSLVVRSTTDEQGRKDGLPSYAYPVGGTPPFRKHYFVDGTPTVYDADFGHTGGVDGGPDWRTVLIGGLNKGGRGYYALDVTNGANAPDETTVAGKVLWEFAGDADMGYSFGTPTVSWLKNEGWVAIVPGGYNATSGNGAFWILNVKTGAVIKKFTIKATGCGADKACAEVAGIGPTNPLNLGGLTTFVTSREEERLWSIYAADMQGNVWRADVSDDNKDNWTLVKLAELDIGATGGSGVYATTRQSVTTNPTVAWDQTVDARWVFVGTGVDQSRDDRDGSKQQANQVQTMYAIRDGKALTPLAAADLPVQRARMVPVSRGAVDAVAVPATKHGWYMDLAPSQTVSGVENLAERIVLQPTAALGLVVYSSSIPTKDVCSPGNSGFVYARSYLSGKEGKSYVQSGGTTVAAVQVAKGAAANPRLVQLRNADGTAGKIVLQTADVLGDVTNVSLEGADPALRTRTAWRELITD